MHLDGRIGNAPRLHPMKAAARLRAGCAHPPPSFFATSPPPPVSLSLSPSLSLSLSLLSLHLSFSLFRATACSQFVSRVVCTHPVQWHGAASSDLVCPPCPTLPFASSGPRESSYIVSSCRVTPSRRRTSRPRKRFGPPKLFLSRSSTRWRIRDVNKEA